MDTIIQKTLRETKTFHLYRIFQQAHESGQLISPEVCASFIKFLLCDLPFKDFKENKMPLSIYDEWHKELWLESESHLPAFPFLKNTGINSTPSGTILNLNAFATC